MRARLLAWLPLISLMARPSGAKTLILFSPCRGERYPHPGPQVYGLLSGDPEWRQVYGDPGSALFPRGAQVAAGPAQTRSQP